MGLAGWLVVLVDNARGLLSPVRPNPPLPRSWRKPDQLRTDQDALGTSLRPQRLPLDV